MEPIKKSKKVLVVGGGVGGMQSAITAFDCGHQVILAEKDDKLGGVLFFTDTDIDKPDLCNFKNMMVKEISKENIEVLENTKCLEIYKDSVKVLTPEGKEEIIKGDTVLYALGMKSINIDELKGNIEKDIEIKVIGDAKKTGKIDGAIRGGYLAAIEL